MLSELMAVSVIGKDCLNIREDLFYSEKELAAFDFSDEISEAERAFFEETTIYLMTGGPGSIVWENFGHSSFLVVIPDGIEVMYDYGIFSFNENFFINFALGKLYYEAYRSWADYRIDALILDDRSVSLLELKLSPEQKSNLVRFLDYNTRPENSIYLYNYYDDNCATRLRDSYNAITGGEFRAWAESIPMKETLRSYSQRYLFRSTFIVDWAINYLLGPYVDESITLWEAMFLPDMLEAGIAAFQGNESEFIYQTENRRPVPEYYSLNARTLIFALIVALFALMIRSEKRGVRRTGDLILALFYLILFVLSAVLLFLMTASIHDVTYFNANILIISPIVIVFSIAHFRALGKREKGRSTLRKLAKLMFSLLVMLLAMKGMFLSRFPQDNIPYYILMISLYGMEIFVNKPKGQENRQ